MIRHQSIEHRFVDDIPERLHPNILYVSMPYATAMHLCCCGCGREVVTPLAPAQWHMTFDGEAVSLHPSIGSWALPCRSHYFIRAGRVIPAPAWSEEEVKWGQERDKRARAEYYMTKEPSGRSVGEQSVPLRKGWFVWLFRKAH
jgi:Family of unknown function (DUF6527)